MRNLFRGLVWLTALVLSGFLLTQTWRIVALWSTKTVVLAAVITAFFIGLFAIRWFLIKKREKFIGFLVSVWGGYLIGALWLIIGISIAEWLRPKQKVPLLSRE